MWNFILDGTWWRCALALALPKGDGCWVLAPHRMLTWHWGWRRPCSAHFIPLMDSNTGLSVSGITPVP